MSTQCHIVRVSSKQAILCFGSNRNKPKLDQFLFCFGLFLLNLKKFLFVSVFRKHFGTNWNKNRRFETSRNWRLIHFYVMDMGVDMDMDMEMDMDTICFVSLWTKPKQSGTQSFRQTKNLFRFVLVFWNHFKMKRNKKSAFWHKPKLKNYTLLLNGHGSGHGQ